MLYKLDGGLDHILVDESQDTSPRQWHVVEALAQEFLCGDGTRETARTLFAVGDEKQSIYGFQGAAPEMFAGMGKHFAAWRGTRAAAGATCRSRCRSAAPRRCSRPSTARSPIPRGHRG